MEFRPRYESLLNFVMCHDFLNGSGLMLVTPVSVLSAESKYCSCFYATCQSGFDPEIPVSVLGVRVTHVLETPVPEGLLPEQAISLPLTLIRMMMYI
jgi:hypothetical protein